MTGATGQPTGGPPGRVRDRPVRRVLQALGRVGTAAFFGTAGVMHLVDPDFFHPQVPTFVPATDLVVRVTGVLFLLGGAGLLTTGRLRRAAALCLVLLLVAVWPGNWWGALQPGSYVRPGAPNALDWVRVPFQLVLIWVVHRLARADREEPVGRPAPG